MKKLIVIGIVMVMVLAATSAMAAVIDNDWAVYLKTTTDALAKNGASTSNLGLKTTTGDTLANLTTAPNLAVSPEINYTDTVHPYTTNYAVTTGRTYVAKFGGALLGAAPPTGKQTIDWMFRAVGAAGATIYVTSWDQTGTANQIDLLTTQTIKLYESNAAGEKIAAVWTYLPMNNTTYSTSTGIAGVAGTNYFQKSYVLGAADSAGGAYQYFVLEAQVPEPGSMVALFSGFIGLVGFGIRRRK